MSPTGKISKLVRSLTLQVRAGMAKVERRILNGYPALTKWNIARVLATGTLLSMAAALYLNMASEGVADAPLKEQNMEVRLVSNAAAYIGRQIDDDEWRFGSPYIEDFRSESDGPPPRKGVVVYSGDDEWRFGPPYIEEY